LTSMAPAHPSIPERMDQSCSPRTPVPQGTGQTAKLTPGSSDPPISRKTLPRPIRKTTIAVENSTAARISLHLIILSKSRQTKRRPDRQATAWSPPAYRAICIPPGPTFSQSVAVRGYLEAPRGRRKREIRAIGRISELRNKSSIDPQPATSCCVGCIPAERE
jgi:hypothetical protein